MAIVFNLGVEVRYFCFCSGADMRKGFILYHKRLEIGTFNLPRLSENGSFIELRTSDFERLISSVNHRSCGGELRSKVVLTI